MVGQEVQFPARFLLHTLGCSLSVHMAARHIPQVGTSFPVFDQYQIVTHPPAVCGHRIPPLSTKIARSIIARVLFGPFPVLEMISFSIPTTPLWHLSLGLESTYQATKQGRGSLPFGVVSTFYKCL
jgi:hypothetical protein